MASCYSISYEEIVIVVSMRRSTEYNSFWGQVMGTLFSVFISAVRIPQTDLRTVGITGRESVESSMIQLHCSME